MWSACWKCRFQEAVDSVRPMTLDRIESCPYCVSLHWQAPSGVPLHSGWLLFPSACQARRLGQARRGEAATRHLRFFSLAPRFPPICASPRESPLRPMSLSKTRNPLVADTCAGRSLTGGATWPGRHWGQTVGETERADLKSGMRLSGGTE